MSGDGILAYERSMTSNACSTKNTHIFLNAIHVIVPNMLENNLFVPRTVLASTNPTQPTPSSSMSISNDASSQSSSSEGTSRIEPVTQEPSTSEPPAQNIAEALAADFLHIVPVCAICGAASTGIHFGVDACAACSAFFRRTVVLNKAYTCNKNQECNVIKDSPGGGQKCRACRFAKCVKQGMDKYAVQHRRDAIGKYSAGVKREYSPFPQELNGTAGNPTTSPQLRQGSILEELIERHASLMKKRKIFYANSGCDQLFDTQELEITELSNYEECMYQLWKVEPRLAAEYISNNRFLAPLPSTEKVKLFRNFVVIRQAVEEPFLTWKYGGLEKNWWIMPNRTYIDIDQADKYWKEGVVKNIMLNYNDARSLFESSFKSAMTQVGEAMRHINLSEMEMIALCGVVLLDPTVATLSLESKKLLWGLREQLIRELFAYYEGSESDEEPELRLANLLMILAAVKVHALQTSENMHLLNTFELIAKDKMFEDICRGNVYEDNHSTNT